MSSELNRFDPAEKIRSEDDARQWLAVFQGDGTPAEFASALGDVARAYGVMQLSKQTGVPVDQLFAALNRYPEPDMSELLRILEALGVSSVKHSDAAE